MKKNKIILLLGVVFSFYFFNYEKNPPKLGAEIIWWKGNIYTITKGEYKEGKKLAKGDGFSLFSAGDPTETFIVYRSFLDNALYVREDFKIPTEGRITKLSWGYKIFTDKNLCDTISKILEESKNLEINRYESEDPLFRLKPGLMMRNLYVAYVGTYVPTEFKGMIGVLNGKWAITTNIDYEVKDKSLYRISYILIPEKYISILKKYFI